jgi:hypothetical protein
MYYISEPDGNLIEGSRSEENQKFETRVKVEKGLVTLVITTSIEPVIERPVLLMFIKFELYDILGYAMFPMYETELDVRMQADGNVKAIQFLLFV